MPIYEYECANCHHQFELMQKINEPPAQQCPQCYHDTVIRLVSAAGFQLKGEGWYLTDYKNKEKGKGKEKDKAPESEKSTTVDKTVEAASKNTIKEKTTK